MKSIGYKFKLEDSRWSIKDVLPSWTILTPRNDPHPNAFFKIPAGTPVFVKFPPL